MPTDYVDTAQNEIDDILAINIHATLRMTSMILPGMMNRYIYVSHIPWLPCLIVTQETRPYPEHGIICGLCSFPDARYLLGIKGVPVRVLECTRSGSQTAQHRRRAHKRILRREFPPRPHLSLPSAAYITTTRSLKCPNSVNPPHSSLSQTPTSAPFSLKLG